MPKKTLRKATKGEPTRRRRRSTEEILNLLMEAAGEEFERNGYEGTKTAAIAQRAGVTEALIFSNFGSKAKLFHDAIFNPLNQHFLEFRAAHADDANDPETLKEGTRQYILELQDFVARHSGMLKSVVAAQMYASDGVQDLSRVQGLHEFFARATAPSTKRLTETPRIHPKLIARVSFATILACVLFKDWLFPKGLASQADITAAVSDFVMDGLNANAVNAATPAKPTPAGRAPGPASPAGAARKSTRKRQAVKTA